MIKGSRKQPFMYKSGILEKKFLSFIWLIGFVSGMVGFYHHDRPAEVWLSRLLFQYGILLLILGLAYLLCHLIHKSIYRLYSLDLSQGKFVDLDVRVDDSILKSDLEDIFVSSEKFDEYQQKVYSTLTNKRNNYFAVLFGFLLIFYVQVSDRIYTDHIELLGTDPYPVDLFDPVMLIVSIIALLTQGLLASGLMSGIFLLMGFVRTTAKIGDNSEVVVNALGNQSGEGVKETDSASDYIKRSELVQFSIKRFRRKCNSIPRALLPINLIILIMIILGGGALLYFIALRGGNNFLQGLTLIGMIGFIILDGYIFFFPQFSLHRIIKFRKEKTIDSLEEHYEQKKYNWLSLPDDSSFEIKQNLFNEIRVLANFIEETEHLMTWPFDYKQLLTIIASALLTAILLLDIINFVSFIESFGP